MTALIVGGVVVITILMIGLIALNYTRGQVRGKDLKREQSRFHSAQRALNEIENVAYERYTQLDIVGQAFIDEIRKHLTTHKTELTRIDK